jgi:hypothetical protein
LIADRLYIGVGHFDSSDGKQISLESRVVQVSLRRAVLDVEFKRTSPRGCCPNSAPVAKADG